MSKKKKNQPRYFRKETYTPEEVLPKVRLDIGPKVGMKHRVDFDGNGINMASHRLQLFATKGLVCVNCGLVGTFFAKERHFSQEGSCFHFNLYGICGDGKEVLMTKDHIKPKSKGGKDHIDNYQVMCECCNASKAHTEGSDKTVGKVLRHELLAWRSTLKHFQGEAEGLPGLERKIELATELLKLVQGEEPEKV